MAVTAANVCLTLSRLRAHKDAVKEMDVTIRCKP